MTSSVSVTQEPYRVVVLAVGKDHSAVLEAGLPLGVGHLVHHNLNTENVSVGIWGVLDKQAKFADVRILDENYISVELDG